MMENGQDELGLRFGNKSLTARGFTAIVSLFVMALVFSQLYVGWRIEQSFADVKGEHKILSQGIDKTACIQILSVEDRAQLKRALLDRPTVPVESVMQAWCPWLR